MSRQIPTFETFEPRLLMSGTDAVDSLFASAAALDNNPGTTVTAEGQLATSDSSQMYSFTTKATGTISLALDSIDGELDPHLRLYDSYHRLIATNDDLSASDADSLIKRYVSCGQTYYVEASGAGETVGDYSISLTSNPVDDLSNTMLGASGLRVSATGASTFTGTINYATDEDVVQYNATVTGRATVRLYSYSQTRNLAVSDASGDALDVQQEQSGYWQTVSFLVTAGESYYLNVSDSAGTTGYFYGQILATTPQEFVDAAEVDVAGAESASLSGSLEAGESDMYSFTVQASGYFEINMSAADGSSVDSYLRVYSDRLAQRYYNDNASAGTQDSRVRMYVREGQTYYVRACTAGDTAGDYEITFTSQPFDDMGNTMAAASALRSSATGAATKYGNIQYSGDADVMSYTVNDSGTVRMNLRSYYGTLAGVVKVLDAGGNILASQTAEASGSVDLEFSAQAGDQYFIQIEGAAESTGRYALKVLPTIWQEFVDATEVDVAGAATETATGTLEVDGSATYKITVPASGYFQINMQAADGSAVDSYLEVYNDSQRRVSYNDNARGQGDDSQVRLYAREGQVFYVRASAANGTEGDFSITFESQPFDDAGNDAARAKALYVYASGAFVKYGNVQYSNDVDCFSYTAKYTGTVETIVKASSTRSPLAAVLTVRDAAGNEMGTAQADAGGELNMSFGAVQGETYFFSVSGAESSLGAYNVKVLPTVWQEFVDATEVDVAGAATEVATGTLGVDGSTAYKITVPASGYFQINMQAADGSAVDSYLEVYNEAQRRVSYNDNAAGQGTDSQVRLYAREGQVFYVRASAANGTEGEFSVTFESQPFDDAGNDAAAKAMYISATGASTKYGNLQYGNDVDCYSYTAKHNGLVQTTVKASGYRSTLEAILTVRDGEGNVMGTAQATPGGSLNLSFTADKGETYFFSVSGGDSGLGRYSMKVLPTVWQEFIDATDVDVAGAATETVSGTLAVDQAVAYRITIPASGYFQINMQAADGSAIDSYVEVYNEAQRRISYNDNAPRQGTDSQVRIYAREGQVFYVRASAAKGTEGDFSVTFESQPFDDAGNDAARAKAMYISANGSASKYGNIQYGNDTDCFAYTAKHSGMVRTSVSAYGYRSSLEAVLTVRDAAGNVVGTAQAEAGGSLGLNFTADKGETYFLSVSGADASLGMFKMQVLPTIWQDFIDATEVNVAGGSELTIDSSLDAGQYKSYLVTVPASGYMQFDMAADGSSIDSYLEIYDANQRRLAYNDNASAGTSNSSIRRAVTEGDTFYVRCSAKAGAGDFSLTLTSDPVDDVANDMADATAMAMAASGSASKFGTINYGSDVDIFEFEAAVSGDMTVSMAKRSSGDLISEVKAMDISGEELAVDDAANGTAVITFHVSAGETYFLSAGSVDAGTGWYNLAVSTEADPAPDPTPVPDPEPAPAPTPDPEPDPEPVPDGSPEAGLAVVGSVETSGGVTRLVIAGTNGNDVITLSYNGSVTTLVSQNGTETFDGQYTNVSVFGFSGDDTITLDYSILSASLVYAGDGNDKVYENSQGSSTLYGGAGDDLLIAIGGGDDVVYGESGADSYWVDTTDTLSDVSSAETSAKAVHRIASFYQPYSTNPASVDYISTEINGQSLRDPVAGTTYGNYSDRALFADGPQYNDIRQGNLGDCYYLASLASFADVDPNAIRQAITDLGDGTYAVRFYRGGTEVYLRVDGDLPGASSPIYAKLSPDGETWVALMEKAYAFFRYGQNSYSSLSGGWMSTVVEELTGEGSSTSWTGGSVDSLVDTISSGLEAGHSVTMGSYSYPQSPVVGGHAYTVMSIEGSGASAYVTVYNPLGS